MHITIPIGHKGGDYEIQITAKDENEAVINLTGVLGYICYLYTDRGHFIEKYSKNVKAGFKPITSVDEANGVFNVFLESSKTSKLQESRILAEIKIQETDNDFQNNTFNAVGRDAIVMDLQEALSEDEDDLTAD